MADTALDEALDVLGRSGEDPEAFCRPFLTLLPVTGVAVSTIGELLGNETVSATDALAARLDELQFDLGEGPCWDAVNSGRPVLEPDIREHPSVAWPAFSAAIRDQDIRSLFAFPLIVGPLRIGAVDLYSSEGVALGPALARRAGTVAVAVGKRVLRRALSLAGEEYDDGGSPHSRRLVHQATGMVLAQLRISAEDAQLVIQGHAFATGRSMMETAQDILDRRLSFSRLEGEIEATE